MRTLALKQPLTRRDKIEGMIFAAILTIGLPALFFVSMQ